jgi:hypothetical protein
MKTFTRRSATGVLALATATIAPPAHAQSRVESKTFVLVHGAWHGGWCWRRVSDLLEQHGHKVFSPTLTGLGERSHLLSSDVSLETHVTFAWRTLLIASMGEGLTQDQRVIFKQLTQREHEPGQRVEELVGVIGRRGGKSRAISVLATYLAALVPHSDGRLPRVEASKYIGATDLHS